jgi:xylulokinase
VPGREPLVCGVDSSTGSTKVELRALESGRLVAAGAAPHPPTTPPVSEQDPEAWWQALTDALAACGEHRADVVAMSVAGQQHGMVVLDADGRVLRPAKLWNDTTSADEADDLRGRFGAARWAAVAGSVPVAAFTITKLAWLWRHEPHHAERVNRVLLPHDWLTWRLTGRAVTDRGDASGTGWWSPVEERYRPDLLALVAPDLDPAVALPTVLGPTEAAGPLVDPARLGLPEGVIVGPGTGDNMAAALGLGIGEGEVVVSLGTSGTVYAVAGAATADPTGAVAGFADATGRFLPLVCTLNATKVTDTVARWLGLDATALSSRALEAPSGPGPVLVPYFDGERTPDRPEASGLLSGLRTDTTVAQLARAAHDGVVCGLLDGLDALQAAGVPEPDRLHLVGGGSRSAAYRQRLADLAGSTVIVPDLDEAVAAGACVQAAAVIRGGIDEVLGRWALAGGTTVTPHIDREEAAAVRRAYRQAAARAL